MNQLENAPLSFSFTVRSLELLIVLIIDIGNYKVDDFLALKCVCIWVFSFVSLS